MDRQYFRILLWKIGVCGLTMSKSCGLLKAFQVCYLLYCFLALITHECPQEILPIVHKLKLIEDCAFADLPDHTETLTHSSGLYGTFTKEDRLHMVRLTLAQIETHNANIPVLLIINLACIYKFQHTDRESGVEKTQIAVGIVTHQHNCPETGNLLYDIQFCPPKGAKNAAKNRPDTLYQNICADMGFNIHFKSRIGKKVKEKDKYICLGQ